MTIGRYRSFLASSHMLLQPIVMQYGRLKKRLNHTHLALLFSLPQKSDLLVVERGKSRRLSAPARPPTAFLAIATLGWEDLM